MKANSWYQNYILFILSHSFDNSYKLDKHGSNIKILDVIRILNFIRINSCNTM